MPVDVDSPAVQQVAFNQCVTTLQRTLLTTPLGWALMLWLAHAYVPWRQLALWLGLFLLGWTIGILWLRRIEKAGAVPRLHAAALLAIAGLDGAAWGLTALLLTGNDSAMNAGLMAVLCGVAAVNVPVYITWVGAYRAMVIAMWSLVGIATLLNPARPLAVTGFVSLSLFLLLISSYTQRLSARVVEGIRLQLANAELARQLRQALDFSREQATTDALTRLPNRRALDEALARRHRAPLALLMLDLDHFKRVNDTHGHAVGDAVLQAFAARVSALLRPGDICGRWGGEEFVTLLPETTLEQALDVAERLRAAVAAEPLAGVPVNVSIGVAALLAGELPATLLARADAAVYAAKAQGRNRVAAAPVAPESTAVADDLKADAAGLQAGR